MPVEYRYWPQGPVVLARGIGVVSVNDLLDYGSDVLRRNYSLEGAVEYVDLGDVRDLQISFRGAQRILPNYLEWSRRGALGSVFYAPSDLAHGIACMMCGALEAVSGGAGAGFVVMRSPLAPDEVIPTFRSESGSTR
ncbi:MAG: hypothetical protein R6U36_04350 [Candidatus Fermentibacteraceae bacterium]